MHCERWGLARAFSSWDRRTLAAASRQGTCAITSSPRMLSCEPQLCQGERYKRERWFFSVLFLVHFIWRTHRPLSVQHRKEQQSAAAAANSRLDALCCYYIELALSRKLLNWTAMMTSGGRQQSLRLHSWDHTEHNTAAAAVRRQALLLCAMRRCCFPKNHNRFYIFQSMYHYCGR